MWPVIPPTLARPKAAQRSAATDLWAKRVRPALCSGGNAGEAGQARHRRRRRRRRPGTQVLQSADGDGYGTGNGRLGLDCNDRDFLINPGMLELADDSKDNDCAGGDLDGCGRPRLLRQRQ